jgi:S-layer protein
MVTAATTSTTDVINVQATNAATTAFGTLTIPNVETINFNSDDTAAAPAGTVVHTATITAAAATKLVVTGDAGATLTLTGSTALASIDTTGVTKGAVGVTTVADVNTTFVGGATNTTISAAGVTTATKTATITTGAGDDTITGGAGINTIVTGNGTNGVTGGAVVDTITGGTGVDTINGAAGNDVIVGGGGADQITGGVGADKITVSGSTADVFNVLGDSGANTSTTIQTSELTAAFDVIYGAAAGFQIHLSTLMGTVGGGYTTGDITQSHTNLAGTADQINFARGTYDSVAGTFTYAANGVDTAVTYDSSTAGDGSTYETILLVGYASAAANANAVLGVITLV